MRFYTGRMFPRDYNDAIFIARHGSWNRTKKLGGDVVVLRLNKNGSVASMEPFLTGFLADNNYLGRPVDVEIMRDGSLLISDDWNGAVYRVTHGRERGRERAAARRALLRRPLKKTGPREGPGSGLPAWGAGNIPEGNLLLRRVTLGGYASGETAWPHYANRAVGKQRRTPHDCHAKSACSNSPQNSPS